MKTIFVSIIFGGAIIISGFWLQVSAAEQGEKMNTKQLFENKCSICHHIDRPKSKRKTKEGWEKTVLRMKNTNGAPISDEEAKIIIDYLSKGYGK